MVEPFPHPNHSRPGRGGSAGSTHGGGGGGVLVDQGGRHDVLVGDLGLDQVPVDLGGPHGGQDQGYESQGFGGGGSKSYQGKPGVVVMSIN